MADPGRADPGRADPGRADPGSPAAPAADRPKGYWLIGALFAGLGLVIVLSGLGIVPESVLGKAHGPGWIVVAAGLPFLLAGIAVLIQAAGRADDQGRLAAGAPRWMQAAQMMIVLLILMAMATLGSWIAFWPGPRPIGIGIGGGALGRGPEYVGRAMFGFGAIVLWLCVVALGLATLRSLAGRRRQPDQGALDHD